MALYKFLCVATLMLILLFQDCQSQLSVCGQAPRNPKNKIVGGDVAGAGSWPWQASLESDGFHFCGGSLINNITVLTAAHCFTSTNTTGLTVVLAKGTMLQVMRTVHWISCHQGFDVHEFDNDICLMQLSAAVEFNDFVAPVCLAAPESHLKNGTDVWITGRGLMHVNDSWVFPEDLMEVQVPVVGNKQCKCSYGSGITENMLCAGLLDEGGKDSCQGDSGGPMVIKNQKAKWIQVGIVSFGTGCALPWFPGVYARVSQYKMWINDHIMGDQPGYIFYSTVGMDWDEYVTCDDDIHTTTGSTTTVDDDSIFNGGTNMINFPHLALFSLLPIALSIYAQAGEA